MTGTASGRYKFFDPDSDRHFQPGDSDSEVRSANPLANLPNPDDELEEITSTVASHRPSSEPFGPLRVTRSTPQARDANTEQREDHGSRVVGGGLKRRAANNAITDNVKMPARPQPFTPRGAFKPLDTLNTPASSKSHFVAANTTRSRYEQSNTAKRVLPNPSPPPSNPNNPPFKKPRIGKSPMQGRSKSDANFLEESQEIAISNEDEIQYTPESTSRTTHDVLEARPRSGSPGGAMRTRSSPRQQPRNGTLGPRSEELIMLPTSPQRILYSGIDRKQPVVNLDDDANDTEEEQKAVDFTKHAAQRRRARRDSSSPDRDASRARPRIQSSYFTPAARVSATARWKAPSPTEHTERWDRSQSPDVLQEGITTRSASSIAKELFVGNPDSTKVVRKMKPRAQGSASDVLKFEFADVNCCLFELPELLDNVCFFIDPRRKTFYFDYEDPMIKYPDPRSRYESLTTACPVDKIRRAIYAPNSSKLILRLSLMEGRSNGPVALDLKSHKKVAEVINTLSDLNGPMTVNTVDDLRLNKMFEHAGSAVAERARYKHRNHQSALVQPKQAAVVDARPSASQQEPKQRIRVVDKLDNPQLQSAHDPALITYQDRQTASRFSPPESTESGPAAPKNPLQDGERSGLASRYFGDRTTRAQGLRSAAPLENRELRSPPPAKVKFSQTDGLGSPWSKPLTYPKDGKKPENVGFDDLWRLDDDEFLNDTLIGFFIRYLQHRTEVERPELLRKMHFFNSYFFDTLNKGTKSVKTINYDAVARWTRNVNLFARDFVIVPVNENLHWFVAIICNLSYFECQKVEEEPADDAKEASPSAIKTEAEEEAAGNQGQRTKETRESFEDLTIEDNDTEILSMVHSSLTKGSFTKVGRGRKKRYRRSLPKYDTEKPIIITFDSLGIARSGICSSLKQYVVREAKDKKELDISDLDLKGMTAKNIPTQGNYSDCGLYMCMYLEQFICDPHGFVQKLLQREENHIRWPNKIHSDELRNRMRNLILNLHRAQEGEQVDAGEPELGKILVDMRGPSPEPELEVVEESPPPPAYSIPPTTSDGTRAQNQKSDDHFDPQAHVNIGDEDGFEPEADDRPMSSSSQRRHAEEALALVDRPASPNKRNTIIIDDDGSPVKKKMRLSSPSTWTHKEPGDLAAYLNTARDSSAHIRAEHLSPTNPEHTLRSNSVTTDFLQGMESFASGEYDDLEHARLLKSQQKSNPRRSSPKEIRLPAEVPETQEEQDEDNDGNSSVEELKPNMKEGEGRAGDEELLI